MKITKIHIDNYKTYRMLDLDLSVTDECPIVMIGGCNGCGKTTLFDAIYHALYGWGKNELSAKEFKEILNDGVKNEQGVEGVDIVFDISFTGIVLGQEMPYSLRRIYRMDHGKVQWSVDLRMSGNRFVYGCATPNSQRAQQEETVNKIISANLPRELSNYFLFDAMKTSELVKEEQINKLIMKNIDSVMGFKKYGEMRRISEMLLTEKKTEKLENENQRKEYEKLQKQKKDAEEELKRMQDEYNATLYFSTENKEQYESMKLGRNTDDVTRNRIEQIENGLKDFGKNEEKYRSDMDALMKEMETRILYAKLAGIMRPEVERIMKEKARVEEAKGEMLSDLQIDKIMVSVMEFLREKGAAVSKSELTDYIKHQNKNNGGIPDQYYFLSEDEVDVLDKLVRGSYANAFIALDSERERLNLELKEIPDRKKRLHDYRMSLNGADYSFLENYERNEQRIHDLKDEIGKLQISIQKMGDEIARYDYDIPQVPDPQYDMLCKLPEFFRGLSKKLLAAKKAAIEQMMKEQLNINLVIYAGHIGRVELSSGNEEEIEFRIYHKQGNEILLSQLNAGAKQTVMQVLLKVLYELGDYDPPVMIDTVMGVLDKQSREVILENYFPDLARQTILLSTDTEITTEKDFYKIKAKVAKTYTLHRDQEHQCTFVTSDYFGETVNEY